MKAIRAVANLQVTDFTGPSQLTLALMVVSDGQGGVRLYDGQPATQPTLMPVQHLAPGNSFGPLSLPAGATQALYLHSAPAGTAYSTTTSSAAGSGTISLYRLDNGALYATAAIGSVMGASSLPAGQYVLAITAGPGGLDGVNVAVDASIETEEPGGDPDGNGGAPQGAPWPVGEALVLGTVYGTHELPADTMELYNVVIEVPGQYKVSGIRVPGLTGRTEVFAPGVPPVIGNGIASTDDPIDGGLPFTADVAGVYTILLRAPFQAYTYTAFAVFGPMR